jgi:hypothetical protein
MLAPLQRRAKARPRLNFQPNRPYLADIFGRVLRLIKKRREVDSYLTYRAGGNKDATSVPDGIDAFGQVIDFVLQEAALEILAELFFGFLDCL